MIRVKLVRKQVIAERVLMLTLESEHGHEFPPWTPGSHIDLELDSGLVRQYSLCGDPSDRSCLQVAVLHDQQSRGGSRFIHTVLDHDQPLSIKGPRNNFALVDADRYLFIAGGIGITPIVPMVASVNSRGLPWMLFYGGRARASMAFADELVETYGAQVRVLPQDEVGLLDLAHISSVQGPTNGTGHLAVYCCGPEGLLRAMDEQAAGWPLGMLHTERFSATTDVPAGVQTSFEVKLRTSDLLITVAHGQSILEALLTEAGIPVASSCEEGICGTCETKVLAGIPDHRDSVLSQSERDSGESMMICVSRSLSDRLVLDL